MHNNCYQLKTHKYHNMKNLFFTSIFLISLNCFSQNQQISVSLSIRDSISANDFFFHISGKGLFGDSLTLNVELINPLDSSKIYQGVYDVTKTSTNTIPTFKYDLQTMDYSFQIGHYPQGNYVLHLWTSIGGVKRDEVYHQE